MTNDLLNAYDTDKHIEKAKEIFNIPETEEPKAEQIEEAKNELIKSACQPFNKPELRELFETCRQTHEQIIDNQNLDKPQCNTEDAPYLLNATNKMFPTVSLKKKDIVSSWAGLRPLIYEEGKSASELSRKDEILVSPSGLISIAFLNMPNASSHALRSHAIMPKLL